MTKYLLIYDDVSGEMWTDEFDNEQEAREKYEKEVKGLYIGDELFLVKVLETFHRKKGKPWKKMSLIIGTSHHHAPVLCVPPCPNRQA